MNYSALKNLLQTPELINAVENPYAYSASFFSLDRSDIQHRLEDTPEDRPYLVEKLLPEGIAGLLTGEGSIGKTTMAMQLGAAVATGTEFLGQPCKKGSVLMFLSEDDDREMDTRLYRIKQSLKTEHREDLAKNLRTFANPLIHLPMFDYDPAGRRPCVTPHFGNFWAAAHGLRNLRLIVIDSYTSVNNLDEVNHANAGYVAFCLRMLARDTGATVLMIHHPPKHGKNEPRGSGALQNSLRWSATLGTLGKESKATGRLQLTVAKHNYGPGYNYFLQRQENGLLALTQPEPKESEEERNQRVISAICQYIEAQTSNNTGMTYTDLRDQAGRGNRFEIRQSEMKQLLENACKQGRLVKTDDKYHLPTKQTPQASVPKPKTSKPKTSKSKTPKFETI